MIQLNPAPLDSENSNLLESKLSKNSNRTLKNKKSVEFSSTTIPNTNNNDLPKNKITNLGNLMSKIHENSEEDEDYNNNYSANVIDENISKSLTNSLNSELEKIQKMRQSGNNIPHNVFFNNNELNNAENIKAKNTIVKNIKAKNTIVKNIKAKNTKTIYKIIILYIIK